MVATVITEAVSTMMGWLQSGLDFHVSKDEEGLEGKSVVLVSNGALRAPWASTLTEKKQRDKRKTQYVRLAKIKKRMPKDKFYRKYGAITSKIAKAGPMPSGLHGMRCMDMPPARVKAFLGLRLAVLARQKCGTIAHVATGHARVRPDSRVQDRADCGVSRGRVGRAAGRCGTARGLETAATTGGCETVVEQSQRSDGRHHHVPATAGMDMAASHDLRHCEWATMCTCEKRVPRKSRRRQGQTATWHFGKSGQTVTNGKSCCHLRCWNQWDCQTSVPAIRAALWVIQAVVDTRGCEQGGGHPSTRSV